MSRDGLSSQDRAPNLGVLHCGIEILLISTAPVHLDKVEAPFCKLQKVLLVMPLAPRVEVLWAKIRKHAAAAFAGIRVDPGLKSKTMNEANDVAHVARMLARRNGRPSLRIDYDVSL